jgi:GNAT-family acetyltransferase (TIGR03103 family)
MASERSRHQARHPRRRERHLLPAAAHAGAPDAEAWLHCGWGRLLFAHTFPEPARMLESLAREAPDERDIAIYVADPHVALALAPQEVFLDPSHTLRLWLSRYRPARDRPRGFRLRRMADRGDGASSNRIYARLDMVQVPLDFLARNLNSRRLVWLVAEDDGGRVVGSVTGVDHVRVFDDPEQGSSLWCLAVDPECSLPGVGEALVRALAEHYQARGRAFMDLSVMHDNAPALTLYRRIGFERVPWFTLKKRNPINEQLFIAPQPEARLNPYARIIINEARRRGIAVAVEDEEANLFRLSFGGRTIACRESLSELTSAVAVSRCDDKALTRRLLAAAGLRVPEQIEAGMALGDPERTFLARHGRVVVKPARGEQGRGIAVDVGSEAELEAAISVARAHCERVLIERCCPGEDLRVVVIDGAVVAAAIRRPPEVVGNGRDSIERLIEAQSRRRAAATGGESRIPLDAETRRCVGLAGHELDDVLAEGTRLRVRRTANLHTGGSLHDVTAMLSDTLVGAALRAAEVLDLPVAGLDLLVPDPAGDDYVIIEANERPGLANHEPQPTAERFIDLLFPQTRREPSRRGDASPGEDRR